MGFFVLEGHQIDEQLIHQVHELALQFFDLP